MYYVLKCYEKGLILTKGGICNLQTVDLTNEQYNIPSLLVMLDSLRQAVALSWNIGKLGEVWVAVLLTLKETYSFHR